MATSDLSRTFDGLSMDDVAIVGGKTASLGELQRLLRRGPIRVPVRRRRRAALRPVRGPAWQSG